MNRLIWAFALTLAVGCVSIRKRTHLTFEQVGEFERPAQPDGLSGITMSPAGSFYAVDDSGGRLYRLQIKFDDAGDNCQCEVITNLVLGGRRDLEGCAFDPLTNWIWVSDESDGTVNAYDPINGKFKQMLKLPPCYREARTNLSLESLAISPDGLRLYVANEDTLKLDGAPSCREHGGKVRVQEFVRANATSSWQPSRQFFYVTDPIEGELYQKHSLSSLADIAVGADGTLYMLERELSIKNGIFPTFRSRIYAVEDFEVSKLAPKRLVWDADTGFANYEGLCFGPKFADGSSSLVLIADGDGPAAETIAILKSQP